MDNIIRFDLPRDKVIIMCTILEKIKDKTAEELLTQYGISPEPPVDVSKLLKNIGISVVAKDFSQIEKDCGYEEGAILGAALSHKDNLAIFYKKTDTYNRKRFTLAHELGHCCKHATDLKISHVELRMEHDFCKNEFGNAKMQHEEEANIFAGELLIPKKSLMEVCDKFLLPSLKQLADIFQVSTNVMAARLDYLRLPYMKDSF